MHPLQEALTRCADGVFPPADGMAETVPPDAAGTHAVVEFTAHSFVLTDRSPSDVVARGADGYGGASAPDLLRWLAGADGWIGTQDAVLLATGTGGTGPALDARPDLLDHPRARRAAAHRRQVRVFGDGTGLVTVGTGLVGRTEVSVELLDGVARGAGHGRRLITAARALVPAGELLFAQVAPGNAASLRAFLAAGFVPIGSETLIEVTRD